MRTSRPSVPLFLMTLGFVAMVVGFMWQRGMYENQTKIVAEAHETQVEALQEELKQLLPLLSLQSQLSSIAEENKDLAFQLSEIADQNKELSTQLIEAQDRQDQQSQQQTQAKTLQAKATAPSPIDEANGDCGALQAAQTELIELDPISLPDPPTSMPSLPSIPDQPSTPEPAPQPLKLQSVVATPKEIPNDRGQAAPAGRDDNHPSKERGQRDMERGESSHGRGNSHK